VPFAIRYNVVTGGKYVRLVLTAHRYKSFTQPFQWDDIPLFAVLTGPNGCGKSQILELLEQGGRRPKQKIARIELEVLTDRDVQFLPSGWEIQTFDSPLSHNEIISDVQHAVQNLLASSDKKHPYPQIEAIREKLAQLSGRPFRHLSNDEVQAMLPYSDVYNILHGTTLESQHFARSVYRYHLRRLSMMADRSKPLEFIEEAIGRPPWVTVNDILTSAGVRPKVRSPEDVHLDEPYRFSMVAEDGSLIPIRDLSSGERFLVGLSILLFNCRQEGRPPKLLLLDEPDAHLHPSVIQGVFDALRNVIATEFCCRVVITTHRPDTIALCNQHEIFEIFENNPRVRQCTSKADVIGRLSANLLAVLPNIRCVFVEDESDVGFYKVSCSIMLGHYKAQLQPIPVFQPVSRGKGRNRDSGGKSVVASWVAKLVEAQLGGLVLGLIDRDDNNQPGDGIHVIERYSYENYLYDPLVMYCKLLDMGAAPHVEGVELSRGEEWKLREMSSDELQAIANAVLAPIAQKMGATEQGLFGVEFMSGQTLRYPIWLRDTRGHDLRGICFSVYSEVVSKEELLKAYDRLKMIPVELLRVMQQICS
jgi:energy-coupling factor transporter ATP-binding protein EcfA2